MLKRFLAAFGAAAIVIGAVLFWKYDPVNLFSRQTGQITSEEKSLFQAAVDSLRGEPEEVRRLREMEIAQSEEGHQEYYFQQLTEEERRTYREMLQGIRARQEQFYLTTTDQKRITRVYQAVLNDHPELYTVKNHASKTTTTRDGDSYCLFAPGYSYTEEEIAQIDQAAEQGFQEVLSLIPEGSSDYEKVKIVYTYVIDLTEYQSGEDDQNIAGVFWKHSAVCAGYASAVQYLLERMNIPCIYVTGDIKGSDAGHAWNIVTLDGQYYYVDATNGDQPAFLEGDAVQLAEHKTTLYDYLCPFPEEYEINYTASTDFALPQCAAHDKNFYVMNQACFDTYDWQSVYDLCKLRIDNQAAVVRFKFGTQEAFDAAYAEWVDGESPGTVAQYYMQVNGMNYVEYHQGVLNELKTIYYIF